MAPILYHVPRTISSPIYQALMELKLDGNQVKVETLTFADLKSKEHLARNPMGTSPTFIDHDEDIEIWESGAVISYLLETYDSGFELHPDPSKVSKRDRAIFLHLQQYILATVYPFVASLFTHTLKPQQDQDELYIAKGKDTWRTKLAPTLTKFLGDSPFFVGDKLSVLDLLVAKPLNNANSLGVLSEFPKLQALFEKVRAMPSFAVAYGEYETSSTTESRSTVVLPGEVIDARTRASNAAAN